MAEEKKAPPAGSNEHIKQKIGEGAEKAIGWLNKLTRPTAAKEAEAAYAAEQKAEKDRKEREYQEYWKKREKEDAEKPVKKFARGGAVRGNGCCTRSKKTKFR